MKVRLDLAGELDDELEPSLAESFTLPEGSTLEELVSRLPFRSRVALTSVNGKLIPPTERAAQSLRDGDEVMLLPAVKGG